MPLEITFTLSDRDLDQFQGIVDKANEALDGEQSASQITDATRTLIANAHLTKLPDFVTRSLVKLSTVLNMLEDEDWQLSEKDCSRILHALVYFNNPDDLIPDHLPGIGYIDDAIYVQLVIRELRAELDSFEEFCAFRDAEEKRRIEKGLDPSVAREDWLADKRAALQSRMSKRRRSSKGGWRLRRPKNKP